MTRLFVAVWPPREVLAALRRIPRPDEPGVRWVAPERWHMTLKFLGDADRGEVEAGLGAVELPAARAAVGPAVGRLGPSVVVLPVQGLDRLAGAVHEATEGIGSFADPRPFAGHLTLARLRGASCATEQTPFETSFDVREIALMSSINTSRCAHYETLATWPVPTNPSPSGSSRP